MFKLAEKLWFCFCLLLTRAFSKELLDDFIESMRTPEETRTFFTVVGNGDVVIVECKLTGDQIAFRRAFEKPSFLYYYLYSPSASSLRLTVRGVPFYYRAVIQHYAFPLIQAAYSGL